MFMPLYNKTLSVTAHNQRLIYFVKGTNSLLRCNGIIKMATTHCDTSYKMLHIVWHPVKMTELIQFAFLLLHPCPRCWAWIWFVNRVRIYLLTEWNMCIVDNEIWRSWRDPEIQLTRKMTGFLDCYDFYSIWHQGCTVSYLACDKTSQ